MAAASPPDALDLEPSGVFTEIIRYLGLMLAVVYGIPAQAMMPVYRGDGNSVLRQTNCGSSDNYL